MLVGPNISPHYISITLAPLHFKCNYICHNLCGFPARPSISTVLTKYPFIESVSRRNITFTGNNIKNNILPQLQRSWMWGILISPWLSVCPSVCQFVDRILSVLYLLNTLQIHFNFTHLINQLEDVCCVLSFFQTFQNFCHFFLHQVVGLNIWPWSMI